MIRYKYYIYTSGENVTFLDTTYISLGMTKAGSKRQKIALEYVYLVRNKQQHAVLAYVQQAVYSSNEQSSKQQQEQHKQPYSCVQ